MTSGGRRPGHPRFSSCGVRYRTCGRQNRRCRPCIRTCRLGGSGRGRACSAWGGRGRKGGLGGGLGRRRRFKMAWKKRIRIKGTRRGPRCDRVKRAYLQSSPSVLQRGSPARPPSQLTVFTWICIHSRPDSQPTAPRNPPIQSLRPSHCLAQCPDTQTDKQTTRPRHPLPSWSSPDHLHLLLPLLLLPLHIQHLQRRPVPVQHTHNPPSDPPVHRQRH